MDFRGRYFEALGIGRLDKPRLEEALKLAHAIRQFEIELYWKRATYFWAFQLIAFTALGFLFKDGRILPLGRLLIPAPLGAITAFAGYLTACGSKFWQENWEAHVDLLEDATEYRLTQVVIGGRSTAFSVSRINQFLLGVLTLGWLVVLVIGAIPSLAQWLVALNPLWRGGIILVAMVVVGAWMWRKHKTDFRGRSYRVGAAGLGAVPISQQE